MRAEFLSIRQPKTVSPVTEIAPTDGELLMRFTRHRDEAAFANLVEMHGPLVLGVCRQVLRNPQDVDDAFQATFLVLVRRARSIRTANSLAGWLYKVAYRTAVTMSSQRRRRRQVESHNHPPVGEDPFEIIEHRELLSALHEELRRLPETYRTPLVLCYLEGKSRVEAAEELECTDAAIKARLMRGRQLLRIRLTRRRVAFSLALSAAGTSVASAAQMAPSLASTTVATCSAYATTGKVGAGCSPNAASLAAEGSRAMVLSSLAKPALFACAGSLLVAALIVGTSGLSAALDADGVPPAVAQASKIDATLDPNSPDTEVGDAPEVAIEANDKPEPTENELVSAARSAFLAIQEQYRAGRTGYDDLYVWSHRWLQAELMDAGDSKQESAAVEGHLNRMKKLRDDLTAQAAAGRANQSAVPAAEFYVREAEALVTSAKSDVTAVTDKNGGSTAEERRLTVPHQPNAYQAPAVRRDAPGKRQLWNEYGVTPTPVSPLTAKALEWMGLHLQPITRDRFRGKNVFAKYQSGLDITFVQPGGPANEAHISEVDIIVSLQGRPVASLEDLDLAMQDAVKQIERGEPDVLQSDMLRFGVLRNGDTFRMNVRFPAAELDLRTEVTREDPVQAADEGNRQGVPKLAGPPTDPRGTETLETASGIVRSAIAAHGGDAAIAKVRGIRRYQDWKDFESDVTETFIVTTRYSWPNYYRVDTQYVSPGGAIHRVTAKLLNGENAWKYDDSRLSQALDRTAPNEVQKALYSSYVENLTGLLADSDFELTRLDARNFDDRVGVGVRVKHVGYPDRDLYFDQESHLLLAVRGDAFGPNVESRFLEYQDFAGVRICTKIVRYRLGKPKSETTIKKVEFVNADEAAVYDPTKLGS